MVQEETTDLKTCLKDEVWILKRNTTNTWMNLNKIESHLNRSDGEASKTVFCVSLNPKTGLPKEILTKDEKAYLSFALRLTEGDKSLEPGSEFLLNRVVELKGKEKIFNLTNPSDYLDLCIVRSNENLISEEGKFKTGADFTLSCENEKLEKQVNARKLKAEAYKLVSTLSIEEKKGILMLFGFNTVEMTDLSVEDKFGLLVEQEPKKVMDLNATPNFKGAVFIKKGIHKKVLKDHGGHIFYNETLLGTSAEEAAIFLKDPANKHILDILKSEIK